MNHKTSHDEFDELENRLRGSVSSDASADFRNRVLRAVADELAAAPKPASKPALDWGFLGGLAAMVLICASLAAMSASGAHFFQRHRSPVDHPELAAELREIAPDLSDREIHRMEILDLARLDSAPTPMVHADPAEFRDSHKLR